MTAAPQSPARLHPADDPALRDSWNRLLDAYARLVWNAALRLQAEQAAAPDPPAPARCEE